MDEVDVLAIFAHPDDVELTVGGTLLKMKAQGYRTGVLARAAPSSSATWKRSTRQKF
jgi:hypothetical protein